MACRIHQLLLLLFLTSETCLAVEREMTVNIEAGKEECFYESVKAGNTLTVEYQVIDGGSGQLSELDISFRLVNQQGHPIFAEFKKPDGAHSHRSQVLFKTRVGLDFVRRIQSKSKSFLDFLLFTPGL